MKWGNEILWHRIAVVALFFIFVGELVLSVRQQTQTFDESAHIYAGYSYWKRGDFGVNPEHPPLVKLVATLPLLPLRIPVQPAPNIWFRAASGAGGAAFLYSHDADRLLFRARVGASVFAVALALFVFFATREMFGRKASLLALLLLVSEPVILANGALVTTDIGLSALLFGAIYFFYRFVKAPSVPALIVCGVITGLALAAKHSGLIVLPLLFVLAVVEILLQRTKPHDDKSGMQPTTPRAGTLRMAGALVAITAISFVVLWSFYEFRYAARPQNGQFIPPTAAYVNALETKDGGGPTAGTYHPVQASVIRFLEHRHLLPEAYLYGLTDIAVLTQQGRTAFMLGKLYPEGRWFYFPVAFAIKTSLALMVLLAMLIWAKDVRNKEYRRAVLFTAIPPVVYFAVAMHSKMQIGIRHVLPIYPFLIVLAGFGAWSLMRRSRHWAYAVAIVLIFGCVSSLRTFPNYLPYSNELWGGSSNTHKFLSDSNVGWASGLKGVQKYLADRHITQCWFAYDGPVDPYYCHIPCAPLPTFFSTIMRPGQQQAVPEEIQGRVLMSSEALVGFDFGPGKMNAYEQFVHKQPDTILQGEVLVFNGTLHVPRAAALSHLILAQNQLQAGHADEALAEAETATMLDPDNRSIHELLASLYYKNKQTDRAQMEYATAIRLYQTVEPDFQRLYGVPENPFPADAKTARLGTAK